MSETAGRLNKIAREGIAKTKLVIKLNKASKTLFKTIFTFT